MVSVIVSVLVYASVVLDGVDLSEQESVENLRRSVAMLEPGSHVLQREDTLALLEALIEALKADG